MMSFGPPGGNGTISLIGLFGKSCAAANAGNNSVDNPIASAPRIFMEASRIDSSSWRGGALAPPRTMKTPTLPTSRRGQGTASRDEAGGRLTVEQLERRLVHARIAGRDDAAAALGGLALPRGHDTAGAGDDRNQRRDVVGLQFGLDHKIEMSGGEHAIGITIAAIARQPHRVFDAGEGCA